MKKAMKVIGYDPGGNKRHGVAVLSVLHNNDRWTVESVRLQTCENVRAVIDFIAAHVPEEELLALGIDTLTAWGCGDSGWRQADIRLRRHYSKVRASVDNPNHIQGAMCLNGALVLHWILNHFPYGIHVTEAHPKVLFFALTNRRHPWSDAGAVCGMPRKRAAFWLLKELGRNPGLSELAAALCECDHKFDALLGALAALRGVNGEWPTDLHANSDVVHPFLSTHYWWPEQI